MNNHGITIEETFGAISHSINYGSYNTMDFLFNFVFASLFIGVAIYLGWFAYTMISIMNSSK